MPHFSRESESQLYTCCPDLVVVFQTVIRHVDCRVIEGHRERDRQNELFRAGKTTVEWPASKHNTRPSKAVDVAPYPIDWTDRERFTLFAGFVLGVARQLGIVLRWGGDWNQDWRVRDNLFDDLVHFELVSNATKDKNIEGFVT